ncbi:MAG TPA: ATP-binding cassette domain-containing protein [Spongiibacteraceae bacterium]|nr:ATP-binding cassette domain-containing protein [Spongiibacteraceae bacterium]
MANQQSYAITSKNLCKRFASQPRDTLGDLSFALPIGRSLSLLGPSGCGKTTLLRLFMGLERPSSGDLSIAAPLAEHMTYVFQEPRLVPWRSTLENVLLPLELQQKNGNAARDRASALLQQLGLGDFLHHFPRELSGGMQMRAALARALITEPKLLLLDEPFAALDERTRFRLQDLLLDLKATLGLQYVFVTHSIAEAVYLGDDVLLLDRHGKQVVWQSIELPARTQDTKLSAEFNAIAKAFSQRFAAIEQAA